MSAFDPEWEEENEMARRGKGLTFADAFGAWFNGVAPGFICRLCIDHKEWARAEALVTSYDTGAYECQRCRTHLNIVSGFETAKVD